MYEEIQKLYEKSLEEDEKSTEQLLLKLKPLIIYSIRRYYNDINSYDDLIQEGYVVILEGIKNFDPSKGVNFLGYMKVILKYHYLNKHKKRENHISLNQEVNEGEGEFIDFLVDEKCDVQDMITKKEDSGRLEYALSSLTERQRQVVCLYYIEGKKMDEIKDILGISYRTVVNTKVRALEKMKKVYGN